MAIQEDFIKAQEAFFLRQKQEYAEKGTITCDCHLCDCPVREELLLTTMHGFVTPDAKKIESICKYGLGLVVEKYKVNLHKI